MKASLEQELEVYEDELCQQALTTDTPLDKRLVARVAQLHALFLLRDSWAVAWECKSKGCHKEENRI